ncbi:MAG: indole-3-glycerol phosphate synthase TrpC [Proteobacteria bacterium]|nr:indole-3-glycerol phosphate synthase TrpC [Pseudomonadota bacterium]
MSGTLARICEEKRRHVRARMAEARLSVLVEKARQAPPPRGFAARLEQARGLGSYALIAEIKRASPSGGVIRADFDPFAIARAYQRGGAACLSVLTDTPFFQGADEYLIAARSATDLPILRKDFMLDPYQIVESRALFADCVLLIMAALSDAQARELEAAAREFCLDVLVEVHDEAELERALRLKSRLIGINNRDLATLKVDLATTERLAPRVPHDRLVVSESGLYTGAHLARMWGAGARAFLVGEALMRQADIEAATRALIGPDEALAMAALAHAPEAPCPRPAGGH